MISKPLLFNLSHTFPGCLPWDLRSGVMCSLWRHLLSRLSWQLAWQAARESEITPCTWAESATRGDLKVGAEMLATRSLEVSVGASTTWLHEAVTASDCITASMSLPMVISIRFLFPKTMIPELPPLLGQVLASLCDHLSAEAGRTTTQTMTMTPPPGTS